MGNRKNKMTKIKRALISTWNKSNLKYLLKLLEKEKVELISSGGTYREIRKLGFKCNEVSSFTGSTEILNGRVKTLHPKIYAGILSKRNNKHHKKDLKKNNFLEIDLVIVNFYPFEKTLEKTKNQNIIIENIDIGGPAMVRAAAKNYKDVTVITNPNQYKDLVEELKQEEKTLMYTNENMENSINRNREILEEMRLYKSNRGLWEKRMKRRERLEIHRGKRTNIKNVHKELLEDSWIEDEEGLKEELDPYCDEVDISETNMFDLPPEFAGVETRKTMCMWTEYSGPNEGNHRPVLEAGEVDEINWNSYDYINWADRIESGSDMSVDEDYSDIPELYNMWMNFDDETTNTGLLTYRSIIYWAKQDSSSDKYKSVHDSTIDYFIELTLPDASKPMSKKFL